MTTHAEAKKILKRARRLHIESNALEERRRAKLDERNELLQSLDPGGEESWFSITEVARELEVTFGAVNKVLKRGAS